MKLLVVNPNINRNVSSLILAEAQRAASSGTDIVMRTAPYGVEYIETRVEAVIAAAAVAEVVAEEHRGVDGVLVAAFGDPGMPALKELVDIPVLGISEAAFCSAILQGAHFSIIAITDRLKLLYRECVERNGLQSRLASIRSLTQPLSSVASVQAEFRSDLVRLAHQAVYEDGADAVVLAGAPLAGLARDVRDEIPVPTIDGISSGIKQCELLISLGIRHHRAGSYAHPPRKPNSGLSPALQQALER